MSWIIKENALRRGVPLSLMLIAAVALGSAYVAALIYELKPCTLCLYQRIPFVLLGIMGILAYIFTDKLPIKLVTYIAGLVLLASSGLAFYHVGVEQHWWVSATSCAGGDQGRVLTMSEFQSLIKQKQIVACDDTVWNLFGFSMATYNAAASLIIGLVGFWTGNRIKYS